MAYDTDNAVNTPPANVSVTENGALMHRTTGRALLDLMWKTPSMRKLAPADSGMRAALTAAWKEDRLHFWKYLFYLRDVRGGMGERSVFRNAYLHMLDTDPEAACKFLPLIPEYGRWDDLVWILCNCGGSSMGEHVRYTIARMIGGQLEADLSAVKGLGSVSLLAKWLPSVNAGRGSRREADVLLGWLSNAGYDYSRASYRKTLSLLRKALKIVETDVAAKTYGNIDYKAVPSVANTYYAKLFMKYDGARRLAYLDEVKAGKKKINASVVFPHDIYKLADSRGGNETCEAMWKALPDTVAGARGVLVVLDGSRSMNGTVPGSAVTAADVGGALAVYFSERSSGEFAGKFITFSNNPRMVDISACETLCEKKNAVRKYREVANTDIYKTFRLILDTAVESGAPQEDMPGTVLVISDMEFDSCAYSSLNARDGRNTEHCDEKLFDTISAEYAAAGYLMPRLAFWNVNSRTNSIPVTGNKMGVVLVSGYSQNVCRMVLGGRLDPYAALLDELDGERYSAVSI